MLFRSVGLFDDVESDDPLKLLGFGQERRERSKVSRRDCQAEARVEDVS